MPVKKDGKQAKSVRTTAVFGLRQTQLTAFLVLMMAGYLFSQSGAAQEEAPFVGPEDPMADYNDAAPAFVLPPEPTRPYLDAIDRIEADYGPYASELSDLYLGLGEAYLEAGEFEEARDAYHRGVMVVRVNSGPNSTEQTNLLYLIANIETILGEPKQADKIMDNILFINEQYYGEESVELLPVYDRIYEWYLIARPLDLDESEMEDFRKIIELTEDMVEVNEAANGLENPGTGLAYRRYAEAHFDALRFAMHEEDWIDPRIVVGSDTPYQSTLGYSEMLSPRDHYLDGRKAYRQYLDILTADPSTTPLEHAEALASLADWSLHFEKFRTARGLYEEAYQVLAQSEDYGEVVDNYLGQPKPMAFATLWPRPVDGEPLDPELKQLDISMTVTRIGSVRYVEILNPPEDLSEDELDDIKKELQDMPFRPSLKEGKAVTTEGFIWQHVFRPEPQDEARPEERTS
jgi:tetratricopeptide (TPR) repeat protein